MLNNKKIGQSKTLRLCIWLIAILVPAILLAKGIYGSFVFTFSIPLLWQVGFLGEPVSSLGLKRKFLKPSLITGFTTGVILALISGKVLNALGMTGQALSALHKLQFSFGFFKISFPLQKELGYKLLAASNTLKGAFLYLFFCIFLVGLGEELFWRGFIQQKISKHFSKSLSIWLTALLFSLAHLYIFTILPLKEAIFFLTALAIIGAIWGYLFVYLNNIWCPAISHGMVAFIIWKYYFFVPLH